MTDRQKDKLIEMGIELAIIAGSALLTELRARYFSKRPDQSWLFDRTACHVDDAPHGRAV